MYCIMDMFQYVHLWLRHQMYMFQFVHFRLRHQTSTNQAPLFAELHLLQGTPYRYII